MRISDWSSDVCSSDLGRNDSLSLRNTGRVGNEYRRRLAPKLQYSLKAARLSANRLGISVPNPVGCRRSLAVHLGFDFLGGCDDFVEGWSLAEDHCLGCGIVAPQRSEEHTSELQSLMRISYAVFCLTKKQNTHAR